MLYGDVYDVTSFLPHHPGGSKVILNLAGRDATEEYDPIHPPGTLDELSPRAKLGKFEPPPPAPERESKHASSSSATSDTNPNRSPPLASLLNIDEIEALATRNIGQKAWSYYFSAADDLLSKSLNNLAYRSILLRPRVFVDCTQYSLSTTLAGYPFQMPLYVSPAAMARLAHPDGEAGIARACARFGALQIVSQNASMTPEQVAAAASSSKWPGQESKPQKLGWQLYIQTRRAKSEAMLARINKMRDTFGFVVLTLDAPVPGKRELDEKQQFLNASTIPAASNAGGGVGQQLFFGTACDLTWHTTLPWIAQHTNLPIVLKGIQTHEDAYLAAKCAPQVKAIILSNHGGRALDTAPPAVHTLLEIRKYCPEVFSMVEVWVDGGIKRGTDVIKALCLGAKGVGIGRAALFGLGAGGRLGVERVFESKPCPFSVTDTPALGNINKPGPLVLKAEMETCMRLLGVEKVDELGPRFVSLECSVCKYFCNKLG